MLNILDNLNDAFEQMFSSTSNVSNSLRPKFSNEHQKNTFDYLINNGWKEIGKFPLHFEHEEKPGIINFCGDDVFILKEALQTPLARVISIHQMESDLRDLVSA